MKHHNNWRNEIIAIAVPLYLSMSVFLASTAAANTASIDSFQAPIQTNSSNSEPEAQIAQNTNVCYQVIAEDGLYVRREPTVYSEAIAILDLGQNLTIAPGGTDNWVFTPAPIRGYVWADWLAPCY